MVQPCVDDNGLEKLLWVRELFCVLFNLAIEAGHE